MENRISVVSNAENFCLRSRKTIRIGFDVLPVVTKMDFMMNFRTSFSVWNVQKKKAMKYRIVLRIYREV